MRLTCQATADPVQQQSWGEQDQQTGGTVLMTGAPYRSSGLQECHFLKPSGKSSSMRWPATEVNTISQGVPLMV